MFVRKSITYVFKDFHLAEFFFRDFLIWFGAEPYAIPVIREIQ